MKLRISFQFSNLLLVAIIVFLLLPIHSMSELSNVAALYNRSLYGFRCHKVETENLKQLGFNCAHGGHSINELPLQAFEMYEWNVFNIAAQNQVKKNTCVAERLNCLANRKDHFDRWSNELVYLWIARKKAQIIYQKCNNEVLTRIEPHDKKKYGLQEAYKRSTNRRIFNSNKTLDPKWENICFDEEALGALKISESLFGVAASNVNDPKLFDDIERMRKKITSDKTGKPLSDEDILVLDLTNLADITISDDTEFTDRLKSRLTELAQQRTSTSNQLSDSIKRKNNLPEDLRDYIYEDGTLASTLIELNELGDHIGTLEETRETGNPKNIDEAALVPISNGAHCLLTKYEPTMIGGLADFFVKTILLKGILGGVGGVADKATKASLGARALKAANPVRFCASGGAAAAGCLLAYEQISKSCLQSTHQASKVSISSISESKRKSSTMALPDEVGYKRFNMKFDEKCTPSCTPDIQRRLMMNPQFSMDCVVDGLTNLTPLKVALPATLLIPK